MPQYGKQLSTTPQTPDGNLCQHNQDQRRKFGGGLSADSEFLRFLRIFLSHRDNKKPAHLSLGDVRVISFRDILAQIPHRPIALGKPFGVFQGMNSVED